MPTLQEALYTIAVTYGFFPAQTTKKQIKDRLHPSSTIG